MAPAIKKNLFVLVLFCLLVTIFISVRDIPAQQWIATAHSQHETLDTLQVLAPDSNCLPACLRIGIQLLKAGFEKIIVGTVQGFSLYDPAKFGG